MKLLSRLKQRKNPVFNFISILIISFFFQIFLLEITVNFFPKFDKQPQLYIGEEKFDPSLGRIRSIDDFITFCDSFYGDRKISITDSGRYANLVAQVIRYRFVHGYTWYHPGQNYVATLLAPVVHRDLSAIVIPDDILKYPKAACSQQSLVAMKVLMEKGYLVRKVGFYDQKYGGHFCYEVFYENGWHFYDPNREPDQQWLIENKMPGIEYLNQHKDILLKAYPKDNPQFVEALYSTYKFGKAGKLPGRNAIIFQSFTKFLSYTLWIFLAVLYIFIRRKYFLPKTV